MSGGVYFIQSGETGPVKIGYTRLDPWYRLTDLQVMHHVELRLLGFMPGWRTDERATHVRFVQHWIRGEWFLPHPNLLHLASQFPPPPRIEGPRSRQYSNGYSWIVKAKAALLAAEQEEAA